MKNKVPKEDSLFQKKGFYVALYASLGVVVVIAAAITINNPSLKPAPQKTAENAIDFSQLEQTNQSSVESYLTPSDADARLNPVKERDSKSMPQPSQTAAPSREVKPPEKNTETSGTKPTEQPVPTNKPEAPDKPVTQTAPTDTSATQPVQTEPEKKETGEAPQPDTQPPAENASTDPEPAVPAEQASADELGEPIFRYYTGESRLNWPVSGEVVMDYSMDRTVYDRTLDQYRTNDTLCIAAPGGTPVKAAAEGVVTRVGYTRTDGNEVVIDSGNGWTTTYSQLQDGVLVKEGDIVNEGQVLGGVASPTIYKVILGNHLGLKIEKDDEPIDPKTVLVQ